MDEIHGPHRLEGTVHSHEEQLLESANDQEHEHGGEIEELSHDRDLDLGERIEDFRCSETHLEGIILARQLEARIDHREEKADHDAQKSLPDREKEVFRPVGRKSDTPDPHPRKNDEGSEKGESDLRYLRYRLRRDEGAVSTSAVTRAKMRKKSCAFAARSESNPFLLLSVHLRDLLEELDRVLPERREHPGSEEHESEENRGDLGNKVSVCSWIDVVAWKISRDDETHDEADEQHRADSRGSGRYLLSSDSPHSRDSFHSSCHLKLATSCSVMSPHPSTRTKRMSLKGMEIMTGGSMIMPWT
jgi:hypothetical protein